VTKEGLRMSLLVIGLLYVFVGLIEWALALSRTIMCARGKIVPLVILVFLENLLGLIVLSTFIRDNNWGIAVAYSVGGALGALIVSVYSKEPKGTSKEPKATKVPKKKLLKKPSKKKFIRFSY
jgi:hypothetical protein